MVNIAAGQLWQHYKGSVYEIVGLGIQEATGEDVVIYRMPRTDVNWVRSRMDFLSKVRVKDEKGNVQLVHRFGRMEIPVPEVEAEENNDQLTKPVEP